MYLLALLKAVFADDLIYIRHNVGHYNPFICNFFLKVKNKKYFKYKNSHYSSEDDSIKIDVHGENKFYILNNFNILPFSLEEESKIVNVFYDTRYGFFSSFFESKDYFVTIGLELGVQGTPVSKRKNIDKDENKTIFLSRQKFITLFTTVFYKGFWGSMSNYITSTFGVTINTKKIPKLDIDTLGQQKEKYLFIDNSFSDNLSDRRTMFFSDTCMTYIISKDTYIYVGYSQISCSSMYVFCPIIGATIKLNKILNIQLIYPSKIGISSDFKNGMECSIYISFLEIPLTISLIGEDKNIDVNRKFMLKTESIFIESQEDVKLKVAFDYIKDNLSFNIMFGVDVLKTINIKSENIDFKDVYVNYDPGFYLAFGAAMFS